MDYEKNNEALAIVRRMVADGQVSQEVAEKYFPELKESEDEKIREKVIDVLKLNIRGAESQMQASRGVDRTFEVYACNKVIALLEKQGKQTSDPRYIILDKLIEADNIYQMSVNDAMVEEAKNKAIEALSKLEISKLLGLEKQGTPAKLSEEEQNRFAKGVLTSCAVSFIDYLDAHKYDGKMCVSNGECEDIENAFHNAMWDKLHRYYCKYIEKQGEKKPNPYSGTSSECNGHTWGMCARDNGVEILLDGELKAFLSLEKSFIYPIHPQPELAPKSAMEAVKEEKVDNQNCVKPADKVEPKFHEGDIVKRKDNPHLTYILKRLTDDGDYEFHAIGKDGNEGCTCFAGVKYQDDWELVEQNPAWSEEDEKMLGAIIKDLVHPWNEYIPDRIEDEIKWLKNRLKSLRPQMQWKAVDKEIYVKEPALAQRKDKSEPNHGYVICYDHTLTPDVYERFIMISDIYNQSHWKPSDEQMKAIKFMVRSFGESGTLSPYGETMAYATSLLNDLKKL